jgi:hypothetical protein
VVKRTAPARNAFVSANESPESKKRRNAPGVAMAQRIARDPDATEEKRTKARVSSKPNLMAKRFIAPAMVSMRIARRTLNELSVAA